MPPGGGGKEAEEGEGSDAPRCWAGSIRRGGNFDAAYGVHHIVQCSVTSFIMQDCAPQGNRPCPASALFVCQLHCIQESHYCCLFLFCIHQMMLCVPWTLPGALLAIVLFQVWKWKNDYGNRIGLQQRRMGASLDWSREVGERD